MPTIYEAILPDINAATSLRERAEVCIGLIKQGWTRQQAEAATGLEWTFDESAVGATNGAFTFPLPIPSQDTATGGTDSAVHAHTRIICTSSGEGMVLENGTRNRF